MREPGVPLAFFMTFTPQMAADVLRWRNPHNRARREAFIKAITADMENGDFLLNGESIKFDIDGNLLDGQNRLNSCVRSGKSFRTLVVEELPRPTQRTIDAGAVRFLAEDLSMMGETNIHVLAGTLARVIAWLYHLDKTEQESDGANVYGNYKGRFTFRPS